MCCCVRSSHTHTHKRAGNRLAVCIAPLFLARTLYYRLATAWLCVCIIYIRLNLCDRSNIVGADGKRIWWGLKRVCVLCLLWFTYYVQKRKGRMVSMTCDFGFDTFYASLWSIHNFVNKIVEDLGIEPKTSCMLSTRSTN